MCLTESGRFLKKILAQTNWLQPLNKGRKNLFSNPGVGSSPLIAFVLAACGKTSDSDSAADTPTAKTFSLGQGTDTVVGTVLDDTISAERITISGTSYDTLNNTDNIDGGGGSADTLQVVLGGGTTVKPVSLAGIEIIDIQFDAANSILDADKSDSLTKVIFQNNSAAANLVNVKTLLTDIDVNNNNGFDVFLSYSNTVASGVADNLDIDLTNFQGGQLTAQATGGSGGYETVTVSSTGNKVQTITTLSLDLEVTTLKIDGDTDLTITNALATNIVAFDLTSSTGDTSLGTLNTAEKVTFTGGPGNDTFDISSAAGALTSIDVLKGGSGIDTLRVEDGDVIGLGAAYTNITGFEHLFVDTPLASTGLRVDRVSTNIEKVTLLDKPAAGTTISFAGGTSAELELNKTTSGAITVDDLGAGTLDTLEIDFDLGAAATLGGAITITDYEVVTITITDGTLTSGGNISVTPTTNASSELKISGTSGLTMASGHIITSQKIDASGTVLANTTDSGLIMATSTVAAGGAIITGSNGVDTLYGSNSSDSVSTGTGNDAIYTQGGADTINLTSGGEDDIFITGNTTSADVAVTKINNFNAGIVTGSSDEVDIDLSDLEAHLAAADSGAAVISAADIVDGDAVSLITGTATLVQTISPNVTSTLDGGRGVFLLSGYDLSSMDDVETALESGGVFAIKTSVAFDDQTGDSRADGIFVVYSDGTDAYLAVAYNESDSNSLNGFSSGSLDVQDLIIFSGISDVTDFAAVNFDWTT